MRSAGKKIPSPKRKTVSANHSTLLEISGDFRLRRGIDRLEKSFAENAVINYRPIDEPTEARRAVDLSAPFRRAGRAEENQMLETQHRFRFAVTFLLFAKGVERETPMMPDDRGRTEGDVVACLLHAPAKIDVVAGLAIFRIEAADAFESPAIPGHVTTGNMFRDGVGEENVARPARRGGDAGLHPIFAPAAKRSARRRRHNRRSTSVPMR